MAWCSLMVLILVWAKEMHPTQTLRVWHKEMHLTQMLQSWHQEVPTIQTIQDLHRNQMLHILTLQGQLQQMHPTLQLEGQAKPLAHPTSSQEVTQPSSQVQLLPTSSHTSLALLSQPRPLGHHSLSLATMTQANPPCTPACHPSHPIPATPMATNRATT